MSAAVLRAAVAGSILLGLAELLDATAGLIATAPPSTPTAAEPEQDRTQVLPGRGHSANPNAPGPPQAGNLLWAIALEQLAVTRERPIFSASRRPPREVDIVPWTEPVASRAPPPPEPEKPPLSLVGTVTGERDCIGIFIEEVTNKVVVLRTGEAHKGWMLRSARGREATLEKNGALAVLPFRRAEANKATPCHRLHAPRRSRPNRSAAAGGRPGRAPSRDSIYHSVLRRPRSLGDGVGERQARRVIASPRQSLPRINSLKHTVVFACIALFCACGQ
jgi:hypothetical protein